MHKRLTGKRGVAPSIESCEKVMSNRSLASVVRGLSSLWSKGIVLSRPTSGGEYMVDDGNGSGVAAALTLVVCGGEEGWQSVLVATEHDKSRTPASWG